MHGKGCHPWLTTWIAAEMGNVYVQQPPLDMAATYLETDSQTPVYFVLFAGVDPTPWVEEIGKHNGFTIENGKFINISMGQGQEKPAEAFQRLGRAQHEVLVHGFYP